MLKRLTLKNFTVFNEVALNFSPNLNVIIGENGKGKSHLLKCAYSMMAVENVSSNSKAQQQRIYAEKLINVFRPESLGRLVKRKQGRERCEISAEFESIALNSKISFSTLSKTDVQIDLAPLENIENRPAFLPTRELLTIYPNFVHTYQNNYLEYEETYYDTCLLLGAYLARGPRETLAKSLLKPLEEAMGGKVVLDTNGRFYLSIQGEGTMEMSLVAEGLRKLAMLARLIATGALLGKGTLFWDEPETNLNPKLIKTVAKIILQLCQQGIQVFVATHSLFLLRELEILSKQQEFKSLKQRYFGLSREDDGVRVEQENDIADIRTLTLLDEELYQSDRFLNME